jgi:hypothetical protein
MSDEDSETTRLLEQCCRVGVRYHEVLSETEQIELFVLSSTAAGRDTLSLTRDYFGVDASEKLAAWHANHDPKKMLSQRLRLFAAHLVRTSTDVPPEVARAIRVANRCRFQNPVTGPATVAVALTFGLEEETLRYASRKAPPCIGVFAAFAAELAKLRSQGVSFFKN